MIPFNKDFVPNSFGLVNNGSICYFNSLLQSLLSCSSFNQLMLELNITFFKNLLLASSLSNGSDILNMIKQKHVKETKHSLFGNSQEDVGECFHLLIDSIPNSNNLFKCRYKKNIICKDCKFIQKLNQDTVYVIDIPVDEKTDLNSYIKEHNSEIDNYRCIKCDSLNVHSKNSLCKLSSIIVIQFNKYFEKKNINYSQFLEFDYIDGSKIKYQLVARIQHFGGRSSGHYTADCMRKQIKNFNDSNVSEGNLLPTSNTYYLFYHLL